MTATDMKTDSLRLVKMTGGLGNQLFIYAFYMQMRKLHPLTRIDLSDMVHYHVHHGYELHRIFPHLPHDEWCWPQAAKKVAEFLFFHTILERKQDLSTLDAFWKPRRWPLVYFKGFYQSERYFHDIADEVRAAFRFDESLAGEATRALLSRLDADERSVSLHVRRGDYLQPEVWARTGCVCTREYYLDAIRRVCEDLPGARFYVFSDDIAWCREQLPLEEAVFVSHNQGQDSWQDMLLMSRCRSHVICNSTFSWWGAWLNPRPGKRVYAPSRWSALGDQPHIVPQGWIRIPVEPHPEQRP